MKEGTDEYRAAQAAAVRAACASTGRFLQYRFLPHIGTDDSPATRLGKCLYLAYMWHSILLVERHLEMPDSIDHLANKAVATSGELMTLLWSRCMVQAWKEASQKSMEIPTIDAAFAGCADRLSKNLLTALTTGTFPPWYSSHKPQTGCVQPLEIANRREYLKLLSRVQNPIQTWTATSAMEVDSSQWGVYDSSSSPDDLKCGLVKVTRGFARGAPPPT